MPRVAVAQFAPGSEPEANAGAVARLAASARDDGADLVVLPEYSSFFEPRMTKRFADAAQPLDGPFTAAVVQAAGELGITIVFGLVERGGGERFRNAAVAVDGNGVRAVYRKTHLYDAFGAKESDRVEAGDLDQDATFGLGGLTVGLQTCYDLRFPEVTRRLADAGAQLVLVPADWVPGPRKVHHWRTLVTARAIENTLYVAAAGQVPPSGVGTSLVVDPAGDALAELGDAPGTAVADVEEDVVEAVRRVNPALALRRYAVTPRG
ncbi:carbon-nitrogen hydrolase family protein [Amnibacterium sp. CER49]|uniref:carbon-nitrogen hydrolase family protein n=1 Tax=Amnibacterium sp. CER49 TaxID=3039161 RepID=UPI00244C6383|nr:carbon-nitrogen hydrolase family protein [Amnibacterium sp. CER49]MDH2445305.1 carbon-nitrogen hydrolase family protein [Amnibacterium sp. CER49]